MNQIAVEQVAPDNLNRLRERVAKGDTSIPSCYSKDANERKLAMWRLWLCRVYKNDDLNDYRSSVIQECESILPGFITDAKQHNSYKTTMDNIDDIANFVTSEGRAPRQSGKNDNEHYLAIKLSAMRREYADQNLPPEAIEYITHHDSKELAKLILVKPRHYSRGKKRLEELKAFVHNNGRRPHPHSHNEQERKLGIWMRNQVAQGDAKREETQAVRAEVKRIYEELSDSKVSTVNETRIDNSVINQDKEVQVSVTSF